MQNPFRPGNGIEPPYLAGRAEVLKRFEESLNEFDQGLPRNLTLFGLRGTGKTVIVKHFIPISRNNGWVTVNREFSKRFCKESEFAEAIATDIIGKLSELSLLRKVRETGKKFIEKIKPAEITVQGISYKPFYKKERVLLDDYLRDLLVKNWSSFKKICIKGVVFLYDEFHTIKDSESTSDYPLASFLSALSQAQREGCKYYLVASGLPNVTTNLKEAKTYTERMFTFNEMTNLLEAEAEKAIKIPVQKSGYIFEDALIKKIVQETKGYPYFLQFYCYYLIKSTTKTTFGLLDYGKIKEKIIADLDVSFYQDRLEKATPGEQDILLAMAKVNEETVNPAKILKFLKIEKSMLFAYLRNLIDKNLIYKSKRGEYAFTVPLFREFLNRRS